MPCSVNARGNVRLFELSFVFDVEPPFAVKKFDRKSELIILSADNELVTIEDIAEKCNTINYEIISRISDRVPRKFVTKD